jgi:hypothetical protein
MLLTIKRLYCIQVADPLLFKLNACDCSWLIVVAVFLRTEAPSEGS